MDRLSKQFFEVSSLLRQALRLAVDGPVSIIEMRGLEFFVANSDARQKDLAAFWGITNASTSVFVSKMETLRFIKRTRDPNDKRASVLKVTPQGLEVISQMQKAAAKASAPFFAGLTLAEKEQLIQILDKLDPGKR